MVEQRSPKPSVACSSRVSPAKRSPFGTSFFVCHPRIEHATHRDGTMFLALKLHVPLQEIIEKTMHNKCIAHKLVDSFSYAV